jgi:1-acyl-sn-glycerol-3-phosphate acyltransferase
MLNQLRTILIYVWGIVWLILFGALFLPALLGPPSWPAFAQRCWAHVALWGIRIFGGISYQVRGLEHVSAGACVLAAKHQSMWETFLLLILVPRTVYILKKELTKIPIFGWYTNRSGQIFIDRAQQASALRTVLRRSKNAIAAQQRIVIFPEGTRTAFGQSPALKPGVVGLGHAFGVPIVPVALDSGRFMSKNCKVLRQGTIHIRILPPLDPHLPKEALLQALHEAINTPV